MTGLYTLIIILGLIVFSTSLMAQTAIAPVIGDGSEDNPYEIASLENLYWIAADNTVVPDPDQSARWLSHYVQTADIDASETVDWFNGQGWKPIAEYDEYYPDSHNGIQHQAESVWNLSGENAESWRIPFELVPFYGTYNGQGHVIDSLYINQPYISLGLFGTTTGSTIKNLGVTNVTIIGASGGGLVGIHKSSTIINCYSTGSVNGNWGAGGLVMYQVDSTISNSYSAVNVSSALYTGGLVGVQTDNSLIKNSYSTGSVNGSSQVGGLVGYQSDSLIKNSYSTGSVSGVTRRVGGLVGFLDGCRIINSYYNNEEVLINNDNTIGALDSTTFNTWINNDLYLNINDYLSYDGTSYLINSFNDLKTLLVFGQFMEYSFKLLADIDLEIHPNFYIPYFSGKFDGNGFTINNLKLDLSSYYYLGLFGYTNGAVIENLGVVNIDVIGFMYVGGLMGIQQSDSIIGNCYITGSVSGTYNYVGGLVGTKYDSIISKSSSMASVTGNSILGGLVGQQHRSTINNSYYAGEVNGSYWLGGLVGVSESSYITNSYNTGNVSGLGTHIGGLVGGHYSTPTLNSFSTGSVSGSESVGGLFGYQGGSTIINSYWNIETSGHNTSAGGEGRTTAEMTYPYAVNTYVDWDFDEIWAADAYYTINAGYPYLREMPVSVEEDLTAVIEPVKLYNYPNPFNPETTIKYSLQEDVESMELRIYNIRGQLVRTLIEGAPHQKGEYQVIWDGKNDSGRPVTSGVYFYRMTTPDFDQFNKMLLLK
jgi:hypothetical protein